jgi:hypothetical protein
LLKDNKAFPFAETFQTVLVAATEDAPNMLLVLGSFQWASRFKERRVTTTLGISAIS